MLPRLARKRIRVTEIQYYDGVIAQLGERLPCTQEVCGSIPHSSTILLLLKTRKLQSVPEKVRCEVLLFKNLDQAEN